VCLILGTVGSLAMCQSDDDYKNDRNMLAINHMWKNLFYNCSIVGSFLNVEVYTSRT
jgi:hypothetical protein